MSLQPGHNALGSDLPHNNALVLGSLNDINTLTPIRTHQPCSITHARNKYLTPLTIFSTTYHGHMQVKVKSRSQFAIALTSYVAEQCNSKALSLFSLGKRHGDGRIPRSKASYVE